MTQASGKKSSGLVLLGFPYRGKGSYVVSKYKDDNVTQDIKWTIKEMEMMRGGVSTQHIHKIILGFVKKNL